MRHDQTNWLIHFVRDRDVEQDYAVAKTEEEFDFLVGNELEADAPAFSVLLNIIKIGLKPYYSFRNGITTIYGGEPAICITEMPIYSFAQYVKKRNDEKKVSAYGIAVLKKDFYRAGGRPVIYGTTSECKFEHNDPLYRVLDQSVLGLSEQYRYVAYSLSDDKWIDWSHEREWRWCPSCFPSAEIWDAYDSFAGLPLFVPQEEGGFFSQIAIIVWSSEEAKKVRKELTGYYLAGTNNYDAIFCRNIIQNSKIIILEEVINAVEKDRNINCQTIEGLSKACLAEPILIHGNNNMLQDNINHAFSLASELLSKEAETRQDIMGYCGYADIVTEDVEMAEVQYMIKNNLAYGPYDGVVCLRLSYNGKHSQSIDFNEAIYKKAIEVFHERFPHIQFYVRSRPD